jgi:acetylglutamate kinase
MAHEPVCIKIGGATLDDPDILSRLCDNIDAVRHEGHPVVVVHGGGKDIKKQLDMLDKPFTFVQGMRVTDAQTLLQVQMVLCGDVNKRLVNAFLCRDIPAAGLSGIDNDTIIARRMYVDGQDIGFVGEVHEVNPTLIDTLLSHAITPVVAPVSRGSDGHIYNVNADVAAARIARACRARALVYISNVPGVYIDGEVVTHIAPEEIEALIARGEVHTGMIPKLRSAADALAHGVGRVCMCDLASSHHIVQLLHGQDAGATTIR